MECHFHDRVCVGLRTFKLERGTLVTFNSVLIIVLLYAKGELGSSICDVGRLRSKYSITVKTVFCNIHFHVIQWENSVNIANRV